MRLFLCCLDYAEDGAKTADDVSQNFLSLKPLVLLVILLYLKFPYDLDINYADDGAKTADDFSQSFVNFRSSYLNGKLDTRGALDVPGQARCQVTMELLWTPEGL